MSVEIKAAYQGQLRCGAVHTSSGIELFTDAPVDNCGRGESFSPTDLVATALGTCMLTIMGIVGDRHQLDLSKLSARVSKHMTGSGVRRIERLEVHITGPAEMSEENRKLLEASALSCPVHKTLEQSIALDVVFEWAQ